MSKPRAELVLRARIVVEEMLARDSTTDGFDSRQVDDLTDGEKMALSVYLREHPPEGLREKFGEALCAWIILKYGTISQWPRET